MNVWTGWGRERECLELGILLAVKFFVTLIWRNDAKVVCIASEKN